MLNAKQFKQKLSVSEIFFPVGPYIEVYDGLDGARVGPGKPAVKPLKEGAPI